MYGKADVEGSQGTKPQEQVDEKEQIAAGVTEDKDEVSDDDIEAFLHSVAETMQYSSDKKRHVRHRGVGMSLSMALVCG